MFQRQQEMEGGYLQHQQAAAAAAGGILNSNFGEHAVRVVRSRARWDQDALPFAFLSPAALATVKTAK